MVDQRKYRCQLRFEPSRAAIYDFSTFTTELFCAGDGIGPLPLQRLQQLPLDATEGPRIANVVGYKEIGWCTNRYAHKEDCPENFDWSILKPSEDCKMERAL